MKVQAFILLLAFITFSSPATTNPALLTIDLEIGNNKTFIIKDKDETVEYFINKMSYKSLVPKKYFDKFKEILKKNNYKCHTKYVYSAGFYQTFYCNQRNSDFSSLKLNYRFENYTITFTGNELFEKNGNNYYSYFRTQKDLSLYWIATKLLKK